jgi:NAD(P)-dependent dehydrogenase (short-subunit alcohol dehydrogenase family)
MKTAVITGGTRGIGAGLVIDFLKSGWNVVYSGTSVETIGKSLQKLSHEFSKENYTALRCDVRIENDLNCLWESAFKVYGRIDIWVNNAGVAHEQIPFHEVLPEVFAKIIDTNVKGLMLNTQIVYNRMLEQGFGAIYNMEGLGSDGRIIQGMTPYGTSKRAVKYFTDAFAKEVKGSPVILGTIAPGMVLTDMLLDPIRKDPAKSRELTRIYNILASDTETVTPFLVRRMIGNRKHGTRISYLTVWKVAERLISAPFSKRDLVSKYL